MSKRLKFLLKKVKAGYPLLPTEIEYLYPLEVVNAWWTVKVFARHIPCGGGSTHGDTQTLDCLPDSTLVEVTNAMAILRENGLLKEKLFTPKPKEFRRGEGNFVVLDLTAKHAISLRKPKWYKLWVKMKGKFSK